MATAQHGLRCLFYADVTPTADGTISKVPMLVDWSLNKATDDVETTHSESVTKEYVSGLPDFSGTLNFNDDKDADAVDILTDGKARAGILYRNINAGAGKRKYDSGPMIFALQTSGGVTAKIAAQVSFKAAGAITHGYA